MSSLGHSAFHAGISGLRARSALTSAYQQGDVKKVKRFFKTVDIGGQGRRPLYGSHPCGALHIYVYDGIQQSD